MSELERMSYLLKQYAQNSCSPQEFEELMLLINAGKDKQDLINGLNTIWEETSHEPQLSTQEWENKYDLMMRRIPRSPQKLVLFRQIGGAAAVLLVLFSIAVLLLNKTKQRDGFRTAAAYKPAATIKPGGNKAFLVLSNGNRIALDDKENGVITNQGSVQVSKTADGQLIYRLSSATSSIESKTEYNTIETPRGGQYQLILPDGTKIWLNAMSSLRYPTHFSKNERRVMLAGEGYFEVAKNKTLPFRVECRNQLVEVLGTQFNINSYQDEKNVRTTLVEGSVQLSALKGNKKVLLKPGNQAALSGESFSVLPVDTDAEIAWKNGSFVFNKQSLDGILRELSRWYNVDIEYRNESARKRLFSGSISRFENAIQVLDILELTGNVHFKIEGRRIIVI